MSRLIGLDNWESIMLEISQAEQSPAGGNHLTGKGAQRHLAALLLVLAVVISFIATAIQIG